jgi:hypothetical protein
MMLAEVKRVLAEKDPLMNDVPEFAGTEKAFERADVATPTDPAGDGTERRGIGNNRDRS